MRGVAKKRQAAETPSRQRVLIDHRIFENCIGAADKLRHVKPVEVPVRHCRQKVLQLSPTIPIPCLVLWRLDIAYPIHKLPALGVDIVSDWIDQKLGWMMPADPDHAGARKEGSPPSHSAPHVDSGIFRRALVRQKLFAQNIVNAFSADDHAAALSPQGFAIDILEMRNRIETVMFDPGAAPSRHDFVRAGTLEERIEENHLQVAAMDRELRHVIAGETTGRLTINELAEAVIEAIFPRGHRDLCEGIFKSERA